MQTRPCKVDLASQCGVCRASGRGEARRVQVGERPILKCRGRWYRVSGSRPPPTCRGKAENFRSGSKGILQGAWCVPSVCFTEINAPSSDNELDADKNAEDAVSLKQRTNESGNNAQRPHRTVESRVLGALRIGPSSFPGWHWIHTVPLKGDDWVRTGIP